ncbi:MAG: UdgX family uracil-DNA binding protein [Hyphomonadaceae bacterium]
MHPAIAFVGEQAGDQEDLQGRPFVSTTGQPFGHALDEVDIDRRRAYITNAVRRLKFVQRGKRRLHQSPMVGEIKHYRRWLEKEVEFVHLKLVVALGASAVQALEGKAVTITRGRTPRKFIGLDEHSVQVTVHPSYLLRLPSDEDRERAYKAFLLDLKRIRALAH